MSVEHLNEVTEIIDELFSGVASDESRRMLAEHAAECEECRKTLKHTHELNKRGAETRIDGEQVL